jgi:hypothetical protein
MAHGVWRYQVGGVGSDPGPGNLAVDEPPTALAVSEVDDGGLTRDLSNLAVGTELLLQRVKDATQAVRATVGPGAPTDEGGWWTVPVESVVPVGSAQPTPNDRILVIASAVPPVAEAPCSLATLADYELLTGIDVPDGAASDRVEALLVSATAAIQRETNQTLCSVEGDVLRFCLDQYRQTLVLPEVPVANVEVVDPSGVTVPPDHYTVDAASGQLKHCDCRPWAPGEYVVVYDHGFDPVPPDLVALSVGLAQAVAAVPAGVASQSVGSYSVTFREGVGVGAGLAGSAVDAYRIADPA